MPCHPANQSLRRLHVLRLIEIAGQLAAIAMAILWLGLDLPLAPLFTVVAALAVLSAFTWARLRWGGPVVEPELFAQLLVDVVAMSLLLYFTGGATNPFVSLYLLPLSVAAALLAAPYAWAIAALTVACYTLLLEYYVPLPGMELQAPLTTLMGGGQRALYMHGEHGQFGMHVLGMWLNFVISAGLITFFVQRIAASLRARERELAVAREEALRNERIVALGTLAAGTAHELATPLATVAVVAAELKDEFADDPELAPQLALIRDQVDQCKAVLKRLVESVGQLEGGVRREVALTDYVQALAERWRLLWPRTPVALRLGTGATAHLAIDDTLEQALLNLLNNAAKASPEGVEVSADTEGEWAVLRILDRGPGVPADVVAAAGKRFLPERSQADPSRQGLGIGLFLANATVERLGGQVRLKNRPDGGSVTEVRLPLVKGEGHA
ncbi:ATP-binding protein [Thiobacter aerophilum]|uniref:histidine kinase n=1 Tax=Thiobacter aerophilum TaxID=3121275 RepID=A0ABV0EJ81_9BURK